MRARIGVAEGREFEIEASDDFVKQVEQAFADGAGILWTKDLKGNAIGVPVARIAYVVVDDQEGKVQVGFA